MRSDVGIEGKRIYEDDVFILLWSKGLFGISHPIFTTFYVYLKQREMVVKVSGREKSFLLAVIAEWEKFGLLSQQLRDTSFFQEYCGAIAARGKARWSVLFGKPPQQVANEHRPNS